MPDEGTELDRHGTRRLIAAAQAYLLGDPSYLPWSMDEAALAKFLATPEREAITKAGALIAAALDVDPSATTDPQSASVSPEEALTVRCGTCDADPGEACVTVGPWPGRVQRYPHESRYGKAREARPSATTDGGAP